MVLIKSNKSSQHPLTVSHAVPAILACDLPRPLYVCVAGNESVQWRETAYCSEKGQVL